MIQAFVRLFLIAFAVVISCFLVILALRYMGLSTPYADLPSPLKHKMPWRIALGGDQNKGPASSLQAYQAAFDNDWILGVDVQLTQDEQWVVYGHELLETQTEGQGLVSFQAAAEFKKLNLGQKSTQFQGQRYPPLTLEELVAAFPTADFLFNIHVRYPEKMPALARLLDNMKLKDRVILQSPFATSLRELRKDLPTWIYGIDPSAVTRFLFMKSLYLETFADLKADVFIADAIMDGLWVFDTRTLAELKRRHKKIIPVVNEPFDEKVEELLKQTSGFMTTRPSAVTP